MNTGRSANVEITRQDMMRVVVEDKDLKTDIDMSVATTVNAIIAAAIRYNASDIHFEPLEEHLRVRIRIDGALCTIATLDKQSEQQVMARIKVMCKMRMDDQRMPQDGRISITYRGDTFSRLYNIRVSLMPKQIVGQPAEKAVLRILGSTIRVDMSKLGFSETVMANLNKVMDQPQGLFLLTGPTGSGKTTTLNAMLTQLNNIEVNIMTVEDPIEYFIPGITQVQTHEQIGLTFASVLRACLRQDPDIIMVGEMRDQETAQIAIRAALTGHLVLSTLHTNDAPSAVPRLIDLGVEPYLIPSSLMGVMAQRLVKCLCPDCKEPYETTVSELATLGCKVENPDAKIKLYRPKGCAACLGTGFRGRRGIYELMMVSPEMRDVFRKEGQISLDAIRQAARKNGMRELHEEGLDLVIKGVSTIDQVRRVVFTAELR